MNCQAPISKYKGYENNKYLLLTHASSVLHKKDLQGVSVITFLAVSSSPDCVLIVRSIIVKMDEVVSLVYSRFVLLRVSFVVCYLLLCFKWC